MSTTEPIWLKSTYSGGGGGNCIEVAACAEAVLVRDSKNTDKPALAISPDAWAAFATSAAEARI
ncbi:DUF397 domain-containing protein [Streptomyces olivaceus]|uniref:DUF397 domain-containing protein n=1 Tax=Streptomyces olivaceus TaxID=47716 RepID=UPI00368D10AE